MATISSIILTELRQALAAGANPTWTKAQLNAALQSIETLLEAGSTQTAISNAIEAAAAGVFNAGQKRAIFLAVCVRKAAI